ncbi:MAG: LytTR family DNA-binding domain-containing protein [Candidatus Paceibacterota bacterium]
MSQIFQAVIVDDEPLALKRISELLKKDKEIEVVATCKNGKEAIKEINDRKPQLVFLDIQMPEIVGFEVLKNLDPDINISVIFVTAYDEFALKAFEINAVDYLMKPFKNERFYESIERAKRDIRLNRKTDFKDLLETIETKKNTISRLMVKSSGRYLFLKTEEVDWIESAGNYVRIHSGKDNYLTRETMINMEKKLDSNVFFRIHRSLIINIDKIKEIEQWFHGDYQITMHNGKKLTMSRNYKEILSMFA